MEDSHYVSTDADFQEIAQGIALVLDEKDLCPQLTKGPVTLNVTETPGGAFSLENVIVGAVRVEEEKAHLAVVGIITNIATTEGWSKNVPFTGTLHIHSQGVDGEITIHNSKGEKGQGPFPFIGPRIS